MDTFGRCLFFVMLLCLLMPIWVLLFAPPQGVMPEQSIAEQRENAEAARAQMFIRQALFEIHEGHLIILGGVSVFVMTALAMGAVFRR